MLLPHRHARPDARREPSRLTRRDLDLLEAVEAHRFARSDHLHELLFADASVRVVQRRLRRLFDLGFLERCFLPLVVRRSRPLPPRATQPVYAVTRRGVELLAEHGRLAAVPDLVQPRGGLRTLEHHLVVTDFAVALRRACEGRGDLALDRTEHEHRLWPRLAEAPAHLKRHGVAVPDAAFTLARAGARPLTFYLEVVRAGAKGGNRGLAAKMDLYAKLNHAGVLRDVYGHETVRAILFATTSEIRAEGFRSIAERLRHGKRLFWFASYLPPKGGGAETVFRPENVLDLRWKLPGDESSSLFDALFTATI